MNGRKAAALRGLAVSETMAAWDVNEMANEMMIAWAAGLFEGEGSIVAKRDGKWPRLALYNTDLEVIEMFVRAVGCGSVYAVQRDNDRKLLYQWQAGTQAEANDVIAKFWPYLSSRRKKRWSELLAARAEHEADATSARVCPGCSTTFRPAYTTQARRQKWCSHSCRDRNRTRLGLR